ncbi:LacI family DNA-binding transcriptional regulator [Fulvivirgaceae bacterium PWU4]|uniref:LacI family DNA-binding transcriptional regulator n=1 Tax=Chryseosolibacter histidini TaxID=2782349 RepID=A0AAP2DGM1_9BACT|nr:substrate-binding domain-containing protein [Chryseosolibacter histidini]MBT1695254.1 LacI family DNA-binding transcriptional regulator [Chryseosolibacter histidini]
MKNKIVRIKDIAEKAGVSPGTVDRVLHNRGRVSDEARTKILGIVKELKYEPNLSARVLGTNRLYRLAALIPDASVDFYWDAPRRGVEKAESDLKQYGIAVEQYIFDPYNVDSFLDKASQVSEANPDGILVAPIYYREALPFFQDWSARSIPFVLFNTQLSDYNPLSYIGQDSYQSGMLAGKLAHYGQGTSGTILLAHIDEDISNSAHLIRKEQGFNDYFKQNGLSQYNIIRAELNRADLSGFHYGLDSLMASHPDLKSIYITSSKAYTVATYLEQKDITGINLIGYDLLPENIDYVNKGIIRFLINQNSKGQGYWGIYQLTHHLALKRAVDSVKYLPLDIVTKENIEYYIDKE